MFFRCVVMSMPICSAREVSPFSALQKATFLHRLSFYPDIAQLGALAVVRAVVIGFATLINEGLAGATVQIVMQKTPDNIPRIFGLYREVGKALALTLASYSSV